MASNPQWSDLISLDRERTIAAANALLPAWVSLVIVIVIGWQIAKIVWMFMPGTAAGDPVIIPAGQVSSERYEGEITSSGEHARAISDARVFGEVDRSIEVAPGGIIDDGELPPESSSSLKLKGTMASPIEDFSIAIISDGNNDEKVYAVGDPILSGISLHSVSATSVILNENGTLTSLNLPVDYAAPTPVRQRRAQPRRTAQVEKSSIQTVVAQNVSRLADVIRPTPYFVNGQQRGYRVYPGRDRRQFAALGLRPGDLIREIDGQSLTDPTQAMQIFQSLGSAQQVSVTVERNGQPETIVLKTDQLNLGNESLE
jgi:general secretion pathway protein C